MKWKINTYYKHDLSSTYLGQIRAITNNVKKFLYERGFKMRYGEDHILDISGNSFILNYEYDGNNLGILIISDKWEKNNQERYPQIVKLLEDYFKVEHQFWFYLETLKEEELTKIENHKRQINPFTILERLKEIDINSNIRKPKVEKFGEYKHQQSDIYSGDKRNFECLEDFWISFLSWYMIAELEYNNLNYILKLGFFQVQNGACIPFELSEIKKQNKYLSNKVNWFNEESINVVYQMRKDWNDSIFIYDMKDKYLLYNWWTSE